MNIPMWRKALKVIPNVSREEWDSLDFISKWLISTRAAVLIMTFISALLAGLFAWRDSSFSFLPWLALTFGLIMAHASNNLLNDYVDYIRGVDQKNYYRAIYGVQPLVHGLMTKSRHLAYFMITGVLASLSGIYLLWQTGFDPLVWVLIGMGSFLLLFYTWPLKYIALGEIAVLLVWGPLMIGGGYYVIAHIWNWNVVLASIIYALSVTTVIFGKHIDKIQVDQEKKIYTLPALLGERIARSTVVGMMILPYILIIYLIATKYFTPFVLIVFLAIPRLYQVLPAFLKSKPTERPVDFPKGQGGWPLYFAPMAFIYNRSFGSLFVLSLIVDVLMRIFLPSFWR
jgi:1,4-dihydroxy-2-naphthoate octaprenyltransferase